MSVNPADGPGSGNTIDALLDDAQILTDYDPRHAPTAAERIARASARNHADLVTCPHCDEDEQARRELDLICAEVLNTSQAAAWLSSLSRLGEPGGALVFACLLHLVGREDGAEFWWKLAAGGDIYTAARCLTLYHQRNANFHDAQVWHEHAERLRDQPREYGPNPTAPTQPPLLPDYIAKQLLDQCRRGVQPQLPDELEEIVDQLVIDCSDAELGEVPQLDPQLPQALSAQR